jgi:inosine-uridine nucleoside N-ribohydrolase
MKCDHLWLVPRASLVLLTAAAQFAVFGAAERVPILLDTDIGDDIDDTWALALILKSPELDLKLVTTTCGKAEYRAKIVARFLTVADRADVPIGLGAGGHDGIGGQAAWVKDYSLHDYAGTIHQNGVQAMIDLINHAADPITIVSIGPSHTVAAALDRAPDIARKAYFVGMQGSVRKGYDGGPVCAEYNLKANVAAAKTALLAPWKRNTITPLDTCGLVRLSGTRFHALTESDDPLVRALLENYRLWAKEGSVTESSVLFDTVAVYLAYPGARSLLNTEPLTVTVNNGGFTVIDPKGMPMTVATSWKSLDGYEDWMVKVLLAKGP